MCIPTINGANIQISLQPENTTYRHIRLTICANIQSTVAPDELDELVQEDHPAVAVPVVGLYILDLPAELEHHVPLVPVDDDLLGRLQELHELLVVGRLATQVHRPQGFRRVEVQGDELVGVQLEQALVHRLVDVWLVQLRVQLSLLDDLA